ncbi:methyl-accepting chemotaxis protein [Paenibacillus rubinfantis]|uniref:methyl-accepting chemotaxis protein n=1 Tax=Paenibacillus rubinfantis TaxID=1720296 RepID=UPI00073E276C|nr:methyl-accepting chemotaxis protein [Paenibacillus rubinfantis]
MKKLRDHKNWNSVGLKMFVIVFAAVVTLSAVLGFSSYRASRDIIREQVASASTQAVEQAADKLDFLLEQYEASSRQLAVDQTLRSDLETVTQPGIGTVAKTQAEDRIRKKLDGLKGTDNRLQGVRLVAKGLEDVKSYKSSGVSSIRSDEAVEGRVKAVLEAEGEPVWFPALQKGFFDAYTEPTITMARLLRNMNHPEAEYILLFEIKAQALGDILGNLQIGKSGQVRVLTADNQIVHAVDPTLLETESVIKVDAQLAETGESSFQAVDEQGVQQLVVFRPLKTVDWRIVGYAPESDFLSAADRLLVVMGFVLLGAVVVAVLIGYLLVRMVGRPLEKLCRLMEEGERGNLQVRTRFKGKDEIGRLGHSFNRMLEQISKLVERTSVSAVELLATAENLTKASRDTSQTAAEIAQATGEIAAGAESLAAEAEKGTETAERIGDQMGRVARLNAAMDASAGRVIEVSHKGEAYMEQLVEKTESVSHMTTLLEENSDKLSQSTRSIRSILAPMVEMTKQTNILSLNASIEASRAGSAGKGFMVIAGEIRELAAASGESIQTVSAITEEIQEAIGQTVEVLTGISPLFAAQTEAVKEAAGIFQNVKGEMERFVTEIRSSSASVQELLHSQSILQDFVDTVSSVVEQTNASTEEVASMSQEQHRVSAGLVDLSARLEDLATQLQRSLSAFQGEGVANS